MSEVNPQVETKVVSETSERLLNQVRSNRSSAIFYATLSALNAGGYYVWTSTQINEEPLARVLQFTTAVGLAASEVLSFSAIADNFKIKRLPGQLENSARQAEVQREELSALQNEPELYDVIKAKISQKVDEMLTGTRPFTEIQHDIETTDDIVRKVELQKERLPLVAVAQATGLLEGESALESELRRNYFYEVFGWKRLEKAEELGLFDTDEDGKRTNRLPEELDELLLEFRNMSERKLRPGLDVESQENQAKNNLGYHPKMEGMVTAARDLREIEYDWAVSVAEGDDEQSKKWAELFVDEGWMGQPRLGILNEARELKSKADRLKEGLKEYKQTLKKRKKSEDI